MLGLRKPLQLRINQRNLQEIPLLRVSPNRSTLLYLLFEPMRVLTLLRLQDQLLHSASQHKLIFLERPVKGLGKEMIFRLDIRRFRILRAGDQAKMVFDAGSENLSFEFLS